MSYSFFNCLKILKLFDALIQIGIFVCICILCSLSSKDPFKSHIIGNITTYFNGDYNTSSILDIECQCGEAIMNRTCSEEEIERGCKIISFEKFKIRKNSRRKLASSSFCGDMYDSFWRNKGQKISYIFDLNYAIIRGLSIATMIVSLCHLVINVIAFCNIKNIETWRKNFYNSYYYSYSYCSDKLKFFLIAFIPLILWIAKIVLVLLLFYYIENGDIENYDDFLDCGLVRKKYFSNFSDVSKLRKCFLAFGVFNLISEILGKIELLFEPPDD